MPKRSKRRKLSAHYKFRVALAAIKGAESINEIAAHGGGKIEVEREPAI